jgi:hypothetical protein
MEVNIGLSEQETRDLLLTALEYSYKYDDWVCPLADTLEGVTAEQAAWNPGPELMGIWDIVLHLIAWNDNIIERIETGAKARPKGGAWPPKPTALSEDEWDRAKSELWRSIRDLTQLIENVPFEKIRDSPYGIGDLTCRFNHLAYHIGQVTKIRECKGW